MGDIIGVDLGGTHLRAALISHAGEILFSEKSFVGEDRTEAQILNRLGQIVARMAGRSVTVTAVGVGVPGIVSSLEGTVFECPHYPGWNHFALQKRLADRLSLQVVIDNDANLVALGERWKGAAADWDTFLMVTLGTGIGGAIVINSDVFRGSRGFAGEFGHMVIETSGPLCACGARGCLEARVSARALKNAVKQELSTMSPGAQALLPVWEGSEAELVGRLVAAAEAGVTAARLIFAQMGYHLGVGLASLINVTGIERVCLGGGLSQAHGLFLDNTIEEMQRRTYRKTGQGIEVRRAQLGDAAGVLGAALLARSKEVTLLR